MRSATDRAKLHAFMEAPDDFMPSLPGWREQSEFIARSAHAAYNALIQRIVSFANSYS